jgi:DNA-binding transcriptional LysR family regulator
MSAEGSADRARTPSVTTHHDLPPRLLATFVAVAEDRNFTDTARRLYMSQSGVSRQIAALERHLDVPLVSRSTRSVTLTPAGEALLPEARRVLRGLDALRLVAQRQQSMSHPSPAT